MIKIPLKSLEIPHILKFFSLINIIPMQLLRLIPLDTLTTTKTFAMPCTDGKGNRNKHAMAILCLDKGAMIYFFKLINFFFQ